MIDENIRITSKHSSASLSSVDNFRFGFQPFRTETLRRDFSVVKETFHKNGRILQNKIKYLVDLTKSGHVWSLKCVTNREPAKWPI